MEMNLENIQVSTIETNHRSSHSTEIPGVLQNSCSENLVKSSSKHPWRGAIFIRLKVFIPQFL